MTKIRTEDYRPQASDPQLILDRKIARARRTIFAERLWPRAWPALIVLMLFAIATMWGLWTTLSPQGHFLALALTGIVFLASLIPLIRTNAPTNEEAVRRIETVSGIPHRPASSYRDELSEDAASTNTTSLWQAHRERLVTFFRGLKVGRPRPRVDRYDPYALRALLVLATVGTAVVNFDRLGTRFGEAFTFRSTPFSSDARIDAWITPPAYTGRAPVMLADGRRSRDWSTPIDRRVEIPEGSEISLRVSLPDRPVAGQFTVTEADGTSSIDGLLPSHVKPTTTSPEARAAQYAMKLTGSRTITIAEEGQTLATWRIEMIPDQPPVIALKTTPTTTARGALKLEYTVKDDYGVQSAEATFEIDRSKMQVSDFRRQQLAQAKTFEAPKMALQLPGIGAKEGEASTFQDFTAHPWAGLPVLMTMRATDAAPKTGTHGPIKMILPARKFYHPMAKAVIEQRRKLVFNPTDRTPVINALKALTIAPEEFIKHAGVYLGMRSTVYRLTYDKTPDALPSAVKQLWEIALRIEEGKVYDAQRRLREIQDKLSEALRNGASQKEIDKLMKELRQAMREFMRRLAEQAQRNGQQQSQNQRQQQQQQNQLSSRDLEQMMKQLEQMMRNGSREMAQQMLNQLREMMENLQAGRPQQNGQQGQASQMMQQLDQMGRLIQRQQQLLDDTFRAQRGDPPQSGQQQGQQQQGQQQQGQQQGQRGQQGQQQGQRGQQGQGQRGQGQRGQGQRGQAQNGQQGQQPGQGRGGRQPGGQGSLGDRQAELQRELNQLLNQLGRGGRQLPQDLRDAERSMGQAGEALRQRDLGRAGEQETDALSRLRSGTQSLAEQMLGQMQQQLGMNQGRQRGRTDPLGRPRENPGIDLGTSVKVPDQIDIQRAREILQELRRRLGDATRPALELDYLERLLDQF